jgi:hypothetical protein
MNQARHLVFWPKEAQLDVLSELDRVAEISKLKRGISQLEGGSQDPLEESKGAGAGPSQFLGNAEIGWSEEALLKLNGDLVCRAREPA